MLFTFVPVPSSFDSFSSISRLQEIPTWSASATSFFNKQKRDEAAKKAILFLIADP